MAVRALNTTRHMNGVETMRFEIIHDHVIGVDADGVRALVDTGSPTSFGDRSFRLGTAMTPVKAGPCSMSMLSEKVGSPIDALLGMDLLGRSPLVLPFVGRGTRPRTTLGITSLQGLPLIITRFEDREVRAVLDTGACVCFLDTLPPSSAANATPYRDFLGMDGCRDFETVKTTLKVDIGGVSLSVDVAKAPEETLQTMSSFGIEAIVGMSFLRHFDVTLDMPKGTLTLE